MNILKFAKIKENAKIPTKRNEDGGRDIYACFEEDELIIKPFQSVLVPTGLASAFSSDYVMVFKERGSTGVKNMKVNAGVIDSGFRNEIFVCLYNGNYSPIKITKRTSDRNGYFIVYPYEKAICQALMIPVPEFIEEEISYEELLKIPSERGLGQFGSSNK